MRNIIISVVVAAGLLGASSAMSATPDGRFAVEDTGRVTCANYMKARAAKSAQYAMMVSFIEGYLTAANRYEPDTFDLTPWHTTAATSIIVDDYCGRHGNDALAIVAQKLTVAFKPQRLQQFSPMVEISNGKAATGIYKSILERAQTSLKQKGLYNGPVSGEYSPQLMASLLAFQKSNRLNPSGIPDAATVWKLLSP